jgi:hypothetical protein
MRVMHKARPPKQQARAYMHVAASRTRVSHSSRSGGGLCLLTYVSYSVHTGFLKWILRPFSR